MDSRPQSIFRTREFLIALVVALAASALVLREGLFSRDVVLCSVDSATVQLPWSKAIGRGADGAALEPRHPGLADQGLVFYPAYAFVADAWRRGDPPLWNPLVCAGEPLAGNPQFGAFDPELALFAALDALGGHAWRDRGFALTAWLRLALAGLGAYALSRALGLTRSGSAIAATTFAGSGFALVWLGSSLGHVTFLMPWLILALEKTRGERGGLAAASASIILALAIYGGHPETAFWVGFAGAVWSLALWRVDRRAGVRSLAALAIGVALAAPSLAPTLEYIRLSGARVAREALARPPIDGVALALLALGGWVALRFVSARRELDPPESGASIERRRIATFVLFGWAIAIALARRELAPAARLVFFPDVFGGPEHGAWRGGGQYLEEASAWIPFAALALALAALVTPRSQSPLARRGVVIALALAALLSTLRVSGWIELYRWIPAVGAGASVRSAAMGSLFFGVLAGAGFDAAPKFARLASAALLGGLGALALVPSAGDALKLPVDANDELVHFVERPPSTVDGGTLPFSGWIDDSVPLSSARATAEALDARGLPIEGTRQSVPLALSTRPFEAGRDRLEGAPTDAHYFRGDFVDARYLAPGNWRFALEIVDARGAVLSTRTASISALVRRPRPSPLSIVFFVGGLALLVLRPRGSGGTAFACVLVAAQVAYFARGQNPAVPRSECFPPTRTVELLKRELGNGRYFADHGVMPANSGMLDRLASLDGYDALDVASFDALRQYVVKPGVHPLLGFDAHGADLDSPVFKWFGVTHLLAASPLEHRDWQLIAGPAPDDPEPAEVFVYRARNPLGRAFIVGERATLDEVRQHLDSFDPSKRAIVEGEWHPARPLTRAAVTELAISNNSARMHASLEGDGLLVLADQWYPGWQVEVDGEPRPLLAADLIFRGVALSSGEHEVVFRYRPASLALGLALAAFGVASWIAIVALGIRLARRTPRA